MVVTYYIKLSLAGGDRHSGILMSLLLLVAETKKNDTNQKFRNPGLFLFIERTNICNLADYNTMYSCNINLQTVLQKTIMICKIY